MNIENIKKEYYQLLNRYDEVMLTDFCNDLCDSNDDDILDFHYEILKNKENELLFYAIRGCFDRHGERGKMFLLKKIQIEQDSDLKAEALFLLGTMECKQIKPIAIRFLEHENNRDRYYAIIILGWIGTLEDLPILNERLVNEPNDELRGYAATAMRQIWYNHPESKDAIAGYILNAAPQEKNTEALTGMIITIQTLYRKKFGIKESSYGDVSGDVAEAKEKMLVFLNKIINS